MSADTKDRGRSLGWILRKTEYLFESRWYNLRHDHVELPGGKEISYTYVEHPGAVVIVPVTAAGQIVLIRSYRYPIDDWCWGVPAGGMGDKPESSAEQVAREELHEEAGCVAEQVESLGSFHSQVGIAHLKVHYFLGHDVRIVSVRHTEDAEAIEEVRLFSVDEVLDLIRRGENVETESAFAIFLALRRLAVGRHQGETPSGVTAFLPGPPLPTL